MHDSALSNTMRKMIGAMVTNSSKISNRLRCHIRGTNGAHANIAKEAWELMLKVNTVVAQGEVAIEFMPEVKKFLAILKDEKNPAYEIYDVLVDFFNDEDTVDKVNSFVANCIDVDDDSTKDSDEAESPKVLANELYSNLLKQCERLVRSLKYCEPLLTRIANDDGDGICLMGLYTLEETWIPKFEAEEDPDDISEVRVFQAVAHFLALLNHDLKPVVKSFQVCCEIIVRIFEALKLFLGTRNNVELLRGWADLYVWSLEHMKRQSFEIKDGDPGFTCVNSWYSLLCTSMYLS